MSGPAALTENAVRLSAPVSHADRRVAVQSIFAFWTFYFVLNTAHMAIAGAHGQLEMMCRRAAVVLIGTALTFVMFAILRRLESRSMRFMVSATFLISFPIAGAYAAVNYMAFYVAVPTESLMRELAQMHADHESTIAVVTDSAVSWYFFIASWGVLYVALSYAARVGQAQRQAALYRSQAQAAQLRALRYQINPHFLFNTLNSLSTLVLRQRTAQAEKMITNLATFFRTSLTSDPAEDIPLSDEIEMQHLYLNIECIRFPDRLTITMDIPKALENVPVPGMILQPLVENAIKHGVARSDTPVSLAIRARDEDGFLHLVVEDDAQVTAPSAVGEGVGLRNVRDRLVARFDGKADIRSGPRENGGFRVELTMPLPAHD